jgi:hypothetical protein
MREADLVASIKGEFVPTRAVNIGQAYHSVIETPDRYRTDSGYKFGEFFFGDTDVEPALALVDRRGVSEVRGSMALSDDVVLATRADHLCGTTINEYKTTCSAFAPDKYVESMQWRVMALAFQPAVIRYHVFTLDDDETTNEIGLKSVDSLSLYPYPALRDDVTELVRQFVDYVTLRGLDGHLRERQEAAA